MPRFPKLFAPARSGPAKPSETASPAGLEPRSGPPLAEAPTPPAASPPPAPPPVDEQATSGPAPTAVQPAIATAPMETPAMPVQPVAGEPHAQPLAGEPLVAPLAGEPHAQPFASEPVAGGEPLVVPVPDGTAVVEEPTTRGASYRDRAKLRRRLRYLRQTRELAFRDLGGFVFDQHRFSRNREDIVRAKIAGLDSIDRELRALEIALDQRQELLILQEPGISVCPRCGVIHGSDANFCPGCALPRGSSAGLPLGSRAATGAETAHPVPAPAPGVAATPSPLSPHAADAYTADQPTTEFTPLPPQ